MKHLIYITILILVISCGSETKKAMPISTARFNEILVVMEKPLWLGVAGDSIRAILQEEVPCLPQSEPQFDLTNIASADFNNNLQQSRNIIVTKISPENLEAKMEWKDNNWSSPQKALFMSAPNEKEFANLMDQNRDQIKQTFKNAEQRSLIAQNDKNKDKKISNHLKEKFGIELTIPHGFMIGKETKSFIWLAYETHVSQGIFIYFQPYKDSLKFTANSIISLRDKVLKKYVPGPLPNSYMSTDLEYPFTFNSYQKDEKTVYELRTLWRVENDFMGGPFVSQTIPNKEKKRVLTMEGYVYAPKSEKRNYLYQLEAIFSTLIWE